MLEERVMPNDALRLLFRAIEQVMGPDRTKAVLRGAKLESHIDNYPAKNLDLGIRFRDYGGVERSVENFYGPRGAQSNASAGRASNRHLRDEEAVGSLRIGTLVEAIGWLTDKLYAVQKAARLNMGGDACCFRIPSQRH